jgi:macrolide transport system ATP-binding/permease protein
MPHTAAMPRKWISKIRGWVLRRKLEEEFSEEVQAHLDLLADDFERQGMSKSEARLAARRSFGGVTQIREEHREGRGLMQLERLWADLMYAARTMRRSPMFTLVAVATLALGIGVNVTLFTAFNAVVLKSLAVADPDGVYRLERWFERGSQGNVQYGFSYAEFTYLRDHNQSLSTVVAASWPVSVQGEWGGDTGPVRMQGQLVSENYLRAMGVVPLLGPGLSPGGEGIVLSHSYWHRRWNSDNGVLGRIVKLNGAEFTVTGVTPPEFTGTSQWGTVPDFWVVVEQQGRLVPGGDWVRNPQRSMLQILARVKPGTTRQTARAETALLIRQLGAPALAHDRTLDVTLQHVSWMDNTEDPRFQATVAGVMLVVGLVLAVACANLANMLLARGASRQQEITVRMALGASRARVIRQLLTESVALAVLGGLAGLVVASATGRVLWVWLTEQVTGHFTAGELSLDLRPDWRVLAYALGVSALTGIVFGLSPALRLTRWSRLMGAGKQTERGSRLRSVLVGVQVAVSMTLLITGGLLTRGLLRSRVAEPGFETRTLYRMEADYGTDPVKAIERQRRVIERLRGVPAVAGVAVGTIPLLGTWTPRITAHGIEGRTLGSYATTSYFEMLGIPVLRGRAFTTLESERSMPVAVISEATARTFWPVDDPIGQRFKLDMDFRGRIVEFTVVGVVKDVRFANLTRVDPAHVYVTPRPGEFVEAMVRTQGEPRAALAAIRAAVRETDPALMASFGGANIEQTNVWFHKFSAEAAALATLSLAALALLLAGVGIYGVMSFLVSQRTREIGVRMALGAAAADVVREVVRDGLRPVLAGIAVGMVCAAGASAVLHATLRFPGSMDFLYGVSFYDPLTFIGLSVFVIGVAALASAGPARRAAQVDPAVALRWE